MSRRNDSKVPKYAFIKFDSDGKTMQIKTKDLVHDGPIRNSTQLKAPWENILLKATVLGLSDDPTVLNDIERKYMRSLSNSAPEKENAAARPPQTVPKRRPLAPVRKTSLLQNRVNPAKRKAPPGIEFVTQKMFKPAVVPPTDVQPQRQYDLSQVSQDTVDIVMGTEPGNTAEFPTDPIPFEPVSFMDLLASTEDPATLLNLDLQDKTPPTPDQPTTDARLDTMDAKLDRIVAFMMQLQGKLESLSPPPPPPPQVATCEMATQTDTVVHQIPTIVITEPPPEDLPFSEETHTERSVVTVEAIPVQNEPEFTNPGLLNIRPIDLEGHHIDRESLEELADRFGAVGRPDLPLEQKDVLNIMARSHSSGHFAKNLVSCRFTLRELYGRNACGRNFMMPGRSKKKALDREKLREVLDLVSLHFKEDNVEKTAITAINTGLRYLWNVRLKFDWLNIGSLV